jgi:hypothetical protein
MMSACCNMLVDQIVVSIFCHENTIAIEVTTATLNCNNNAFTSIGVAIIQDGFS